MADERFGPVDPAQALLGGGLELRELDQVLPAHFFDVLGEIEADQAAVSKLGEVTMIERLKRQPYGQIEFAVKDPNGYVLVFAERVNPKP